MKKICPRTGPILPYFSMSYNTLFGYVRIMLRNYICRRFNLRKGRSIMFIVTGESDANTSRVRLPMPRVPAYTRVFQQSYCHPIWSDQPVIGKKDHLPIAEVPRPDWPAP